MMRRDQAAFFVCGRCLSLVVVFCWITGTNWHLKCILEDRKQEDLDDEYEEHHLDDQVQN